MKKIYLVEAFDTAQWRLYAPIAFETEEEADKYCIENAKRHNDIIYGWKLIQVGKMEISKFKIGDAVQKIKGSQWRGKVVGTYSTELTPEGYAVESFTEKGSVQIYPAAALEKIEDEQR